MKKRIQYQVVSICFCALLISRLHAADPQLPDNWQKQHLYELDKTTKALPGLTASAKSDLFADWMAANDWQSMKLELNDLYNLYSLVNADSVDRRHFSAKWQGFLTAPSSGTYSLKQVQQYKGADSRLKVVIDGKTVLDTSDPRSSDKRFTSQPIELTASRPVPIRVEMIHDVARIEVSEGAPMVLLTWKSGEAKDAIIPSTAFTPPEGFGKAGAHGLRGEYFADMAFKDLRSTRLDPALDLVASWPPVAPIHEKEATAVFNACKAKLLDDSFLERAAKDTKSTALSYSMWRIAYRMRAIERQQLVQKLTSHPEVLKVISPSIMARLMQAIYMLPGKEHLTLIGEWSLARPQHRYRVVDSAVVATGFYENTDYDYYWRMGHVLQGPYWSDVDTLWKKYMVRPNGEANLAVAYMTAYSAREENYRSEGRFLIKHNARIQQELDDKSVSGDKRATWLFAHTFGDEVMHSGHPVISPNSKHLAEARLVAESSDYKFWALWEIAGRHAQRGEVDRLNKALGRIAGDTPDEQAKIADWRKKAATIDAANVKRAADRKAERVDAVVAEFQRRLTLAQQHKDETEIVRYQQQLDSVQAEKKNQ